jgi:hypothetical protein
VIACWPEDSSIAAARDALFQRRVVVCDEVVKLLHRDRPALAAGLALPGFDRTSVKAISPSLPVLSVIAPPQSTQKQISVRRVGPLTIRLHGIERRLMDQRHFDGNDLAYGFQRLVLGALVELWRPIYRSTKSEGYSVVDIVLIIIGRGPPAYPRIRQHIRSPATGLSVCAAAEALK